MPARPRRVIVLYNTDYDAELIEASAVDVSAVRESALAIRDAVAACGYDTGLVGVHGVDLPDVIGALRAAPPDLVFNLCESLSGDARNEVVLPAVMDMLGVRYTGTASLALALCLHKDRGKDVLRARGVPTPPHVTLGGPSELDRRAGELAELDYPMFLKLAHEDASVGIEAANRVADAASLADRARAMWARHPQPVIAEKYIDGREVNVTLLGNGDALDVLPLHEIDFSAMPADRPRIVSYAAKWDETHVDYAGTVPVPIRDVSGDVRRAIEDVARRAFRALGLRDFGRVDLRVDATGTPWVIDVNPNCDLSPDAGVARAARAAGMDHPALIGRVIEIAWRRYADDPSGETR